MANGHVEIHDPFSNNNVASSDNEPTSQTTSMDDTVEFRLLMAYSQRRRPRTVPNVRFSGQMDPPSPQKDGEVKTERKRKRKGVKGVFRMFNCIKPPIKKDEPPEPASTGSEPELRVGTFTIGEFQNLQFQTLKVLKVDFNSLGLDEDLGFIAAGFVSDISDDVEKKDEKDELDEAAGKLTEIADEIPFIPPDIEMDSPREISKATLTKQIQFLSNLSAAL